MLSGGLWASLPRLDRVGECLAPLLRAIPRTVRYLTNHAEPLLQSNVCPPGRIEMRKCLPGDATARHIRAPLPGHARGAGTAPPWMGHGQRCLVTAVSPRCPGRCLGGAGSLAMCNASVMRLLLLPTLPSPVVAAVASVGHGLQTSRARWHWAEAHGEQAHRPTRAMLLVASGSLRVRLVVPITACAAAGPESLLGAAARGDWACVLAAESGHARRAAQVSRAACAIRGAATPKS